MPSSIGLAFQIVDDILDVVGDEKELGKPIGSDEKNNKTTYVTLFGMDAAREQVASLSNRAIQTMKGLGQGNEYLEELFISLIHREK